MVVLLQSAVTLLTVSDSAEKYVGQGEGQGQLRKVNIEIFSHAAAAAGKRHKDKTHSFDNLELKLRSSGDLPRRNLSTSMTLVDLREGTFTAQIPLNAFSITSDLTVKVIDSSLELYVNDDAVRDTKGNTCRSNEGHISYLRGGQHPKLSMQFSAQCATADMINGPKSPKGFNNLHKKRPRTL